MKDKSVPYHSFIMRRVPGSPVPDYVLPTGYKFALYEKGDEEDWAKITLTHGEFASVDDSLAYFRSEFKEYHDELSRRSLFLVNPQGEKIGTHTNWWHYTGTRRDPWIKWVFIKPDYLGKGLGQCLFYEGLRQMIAIEGDREVYLQTQTWSYKGVNIYRKAGFYIATEDTLGGYDNSDAQKAEEVMKQYYR